MNEIYANVRSESKYFAGQHQKKPFPVTLVPDGGGYHWQGGSGGHYRTTDLCFFTKEKNLFREFNLSNLSELPQLEITKKAILDGIGEDWSSDYWETIINLADELFTIASNEYESALKREAEESEWY
ncbi:hypothetical protein [Endozoicomonas sp. ONNA1]|uniref:hypothetical protein n=1 Tax=Endozoicomonas sp. ONNA1 TaxID=2828740 RepID=UPI002147638D|nr:hypothetical protein [Endozoicomonas sp. ONNA1]